MTMVAPKKVIIITTGDEVLHGEITNTNAAWISERCRDLGYAPLRHITVGDDAAAIGAVCKEAAAMADVVIVSGGLGATVDDITLEAAAKAFNVPMECRPEIWKGIQDFFQRIGRPCAETNKRQAVVPKGAVTLANTVGTAPGVQAAFGRATFFFVPGVPAEMRQIVRDHIAPWLKAHAGNAHPVLRVLRCFGLPEASVDQILRGVDLGPTVRLGFRATFPEVRIKLSAIAASPAVAAAAVAQAETVVRAAVGEYIYGADEETLPGVVVRRCTERRWTMAVAESCTGGYIAHQITNVPGASAVFTRGVVAYSNDTKHDLLGVPADLIAKHGAVSAEVARVMAEGVRTTSGATLGLAVTGIAGPTGGTTQKPVGTVYIALAHAKDTEVVHHCFARERVEFKMLVGAMALDMVRRYETGASCSVPRAS